MHGDSHQMLEAISDPALFERIATAVLRRQGKLSENIVHVGVNADGKTVRSPVDGMAVDRDGTHLILHQHSITDRSSLRGKWLGEDGDVEKAMALLQKERLRNSEINLTLYLTTNRVPRHDLVLDLHDVARQRGFTVHIVDQSQIAEFLDIHPDGQWIRLQHLGTSQVRLSVDRLSEISADSVASYEAHISSDCADRIARVFQEQVSARISIPGITLLSMPSGSGKSTFCAELLGQWVGLGHHGIWLHQDGTFEATTASSAITRYLQGMSPGLSVHCGDEALSIVGDAPLLVVIDDINHLRNRADMLKKLCGWGKVSREKLTKFHLLVPVWPDTLEQVDRSLWSLLADNIVTASGFVEAEAVDAVTRRAERSGGRLTKLSAVGIANSLGHDPLLIGLWNPTGRSGHDPGEILASFISRSCTEASDAGATPWDLKNALVELAYHMLERRVLEPSWGDAVVWFEKFPDGLNGLRRLMDQKRVISVSDERLGFRLQFRHDRVRATLLAKALREKMDTDALPEHLWREPYYAEFLGEALVSPEVRAELIASAVQRNPLSLAYALQYLAGGDDGQCQIVAEALRSWLMSADGVSTGSKSLRWEIQRVLSRTESSHVLSLSKLFSEKTWALHAAGLRNGDSMAGAAFCYSNYPSLQYAFRDDLVAHARAHHSETLIAGITTALGTETDRERVKGYLNFAGELALMELADPILRNWDRVGCQHRDVASYFWPLAQCGHVEPALYLNPVLDAWDELEATRADDEGDGILADGSIVQAFRRHMPKTVIHHLIERASEGGKIASLIIAGLLADLDDPDALLTYAKWRADIARERENAGETPAFFSDVVRRMRSENVPYSAESRCALMLRWKDPFEDKHLRQHVFDVWRCMATAEDVPLLQNVGRDDFLYDRALRLRAELGDKISYPEIGARLLDADQQFSWWSCLRSSWENAMPFLDEEFKRWAAPTFKPDWVTQYFIAEILLKMPAVHAERLLFEHWDVLGRITRYIHVALYVATPKTIALAQGRLADTDDVKEAIRHLTSTWQVGGTKTPGQVTLPRLEAIRPYFSEMEDLEIEHLWTDCNRNGLFDWRRAFLDPFLSPKLSTYREVNDDAYLEDLSNLKCEGPYSGRAHHKVEQSSERGDPPDRLPELLRRWLIAENSIEAFRVVGDFLSAMRCRRHLIILDEVDLDPGETDAVRRNTSFTVMRHSLS